MFESYPNQPDNKQSSQAELPPDTQDPAPTPPKKQPEISRRKFLQYLAAGTGAAIGAGIYGKFNRIINLAGRNIVDGTIFQDIQEVLDSLLPKPERLELAEEISYNSEWLAEIFISMHFFQIKDKPSQRMAFLEITNTCRILQTRSIGSDLENAFGDISHNFMTLPYPQHETDNRYLMYASFNFDGERPDVSHADQSQVRGGLVFQDGQVRVGFPGDFSDYSFVTPYENYNPQTPNSAQIEYFFTMDSRDIHAGLTAIEEIPSETFKKVVYKNSV